MYIALAAYIAFSTQNACSHHGDRDRDRDRDREWQDGTRTAPVHFTATPTEPVAEFTQRNHFDSPSQSHVVQRPIFFVPYSVWNVWG